VTPTRSSSGSNSLREPSRLLCELLISRRASSNSGRLRNASASRSSIFRTGSFSGVSIGVVGIRCASRMARLVALGISEVLASRRDTRLRPCQLHRRRRQSLLLYLDIFDKAHQMELGELVFCRVALKLKSISVPVLKPFSSPRSPV
jgi:hypothetical protein